MELDTELSSETADTEVYCVVVVEARNLGSQEEVLISLWILRDSHNCHKLFKGANAELEEVKFVLKDGECMRYNSTEIDFAFCNELTASFNIRSDSR